MINMSNFCGGGDITKIYIVGAGGTGSTTNTDIYVTGFTYDNGILTISQNGGQPNLSVILPTFITGNTDYYVTGGTYSNGTLTLNRQNGGVNISGLSTGYTLTSSAINTVLGYTPLSAYTDNYVTGGTYSNGTLTLNRQNGSVSITGLKFTGNTSGDCISDLYISNIHSCSPLRINPLDEGNVYFGSTSGVTIDVINKRIGVNTSTPNYSFESLSTSAVDSIMYFDGGNLANSNIVSASDTSVKVPSLVLWDRGIGPYSGTGTSMYIGLDRASSSIYASRNDVIYVNNFLNKGHHFVTNNSGVKSVKMNILSNGNVGIGVNNPTVKLHLSGDSIFEQSKLTINQQTGIVGIDIVNSTEAMYQLTRNVNDWALVGKSDTGFYFYSNDKKPITFWTNGTEKMRVTSGGTLNISSTPTTDTSITTYYLTRDSVTGDVKQKLIPGPTVYGLFAQTGNSTSITGTNVESSLIGSGLGTLSVPANTFKVGDSFVAKLYGHITCVGTATIEIRVKSGSVLLADTGIIALDVTTNKHWSIEVSFTIRSLGIASVGSIVSGGLFNYIKNSGLNFEGSNFVNLNNTTFDTTILNTLDITAQWNTNNAGNNIYSAIFVLNKIY